MNGMSPPSEKPQQRPASRMSGFLNSVADAGLQALRGRRAEAVPKSRLAEMRLLCDQLVSTLGEASGTALARRALKVWHAMDDAERFCFFEMLRDVYGIDRAALRDAARAYGESGAEADLHALLPLAEPPRQELFRRLNMAPDGTAALVRMREALRMARRSDPSLGEIDADMRHLFASWFNRGFLTLRAIDWQTPAAVLEKLIEYETVHQMSGWEDLRRRLASDRRCFAFFHSALPADPLVFVEVALVTGLPRRIGPILATSRPELEPEAADTAVFYSINNCLEGLLGISFGNFLIKQVVAELAREMPYITRYATLSPMPGFGDWLAEERAAGRLTQAETLEMLDDPDWPENAEVSAALEPVLTALAARYLLHARRGAEPRDPVARFHLRNGARLERINWLGDLSPDRLRESHGLLVNYVYDLPLIETHHEDYIKQGVIAASREVQAMAGSEA